MLLGEEEQSNTFRHEIVGTVRRRGRGKRTSTFRHNTEVPVRYLFVRGRDIVINLQTHDLGALRGKDC